MTKSWVNQLLILLGGQDHGLDSGKECCVTDLIGTIFAHELLSTLRYSKLSPPQCWPGALKYHSLHHCLSASVSVKFS